MFKGTAASLICLACLNAYSTAVSAENSYGGLSIGFLDYSEEGIGDDGSLQSLYGRLGVQVNDILSAELRLGFGVGDDTLTAFGIDADLELDQTFGLYFRGGLPISGPFNPYVAIGYTRVELTASVPGFSVSESESDVSYGLGVDYDLNVEMSLTLEYMNLFDKDGVEISSLSLGFLSHF